MRIGMEQVFQSWGYTNCSDAQVFEEELKLAVQADQLGLDEVWVVEHHFEDYSFCPDNFVYLAHVAALFLEGTFKFFVVNKVGHV